MDDSSFRQPRTRKDSDVCEDYNIQSTNDDAAECKASAVNLGYWKDPYVKYFIKKAERKAPEINRGYYARVKVVKTLIKKFLKVAGPEAQIVNLGAGFDTLYWHFTEKGAQFKNFVEIDFSSVTAKKIHHITKAHCPLSGLISENDSEIKQSGHRDLHGPRYNLIGADIRDVHELDLRLNEAHLDDQAPTLFLAECVLIYMAGEQSNKLLEYLAQKFSTSCFINYELVNLGDKFGDIFKQNMTTRGLTLAGVNICKSLDSQTERFVNGRWPLVKTYTMNDVYDKHLSKSGRERIEKIEFLDEKELLTQLLMHYCVVIAVKDSKNVGLSQLFFD